MQNELDVIITNISKEDYEKLYNIAANKGISFPLFMKQSLTRIADKYRDKDNEVTFTEKCKYLQIRAVNKCTFETLTKVCQKLHCGISPFLKIELHKLIEEYPKDMTVKPVISAYHYRLKD